MISHFLPYYCVFKVPYLYEHFKLKNAGTTHDKIEAIVWFKPAICRYKPRANQLAYLAENIQDGQHEIHYAHYNKVKIWG